MTKKKKVNIGLINSDFACININSAGIDVGSSSHFVSVPKDRDSNNVREFSSFTDDLEELCDWLISCKIDTVAMESTGVYWISLYEMLDSKGINVNLVDARKVKNVSGRKTDVLDCQWLQQLHSYGLLTGAFRPKDDICELRSYLRHRDMLIRKAAEHISRMQKSLHQMNIKLDKVVGDITGVTGMKIMNAIVSGETDSLKLAKLRDHRCKNSVLTIAKALKGNYRKEHVFSLKQSLDLYSYHQDKILECDKEIEKCLISLDTDSDMKQGKKEDVKIKKNKKNDFNFHTAAYLKRLTGIDITKIPGINDNIALKIIGELGFDVSSSFRSSSAFASWLGLCPGNKISGGKILNSRTKRNPCKTAQYFRMAAYTLHNSKSSLGGFLRRMKSRVGSPKAITATAHKLAKMFYNMITRGEEYVEAGQDYYNKTYKQKVIKNLTKKASEFGMKLIPQ